MIRKFENGNDYVRPLEGNIILRREGIIKAVTRENVKINVAGILYEKFENEEYQYVFTPYWDIIDGCTSDEFFGIPGIDLDLRLDQYYRVNYEPIFITERTPSASREDLWELLETVGMDYYDRFEWLLRTDMRAANDNLIVEPKREESLYVGLGKNKEALPAVDFFYEEKDREGNVYSALLEQVQYGDTVVVEDLEQLETNEQKFSCLLRNLLCKGVDVLDVSSRIKYGKTERTALLTLLNLQRRKYEKQRKQNRMKGIAKAKAEGKYRGRKKIEVDETYFSDIYRCMKQGEMTQKEAMERLHLTSRSTFYRRMKEYERRLKSLA